MTNLDLCAVAHGLDGRTLLGLLPGVNPAHLPEIRREFARWLTGPGRALGLGSWPEAWNSWTGATEHRLGTVVYTPDRCMTCGGKGWSASTVSRNLARTGNAMLCGDCRGSRRGQPTSTTARYAPVSPSPAAGH